MDWLCRWCVRSERGTRTRRWAWTAARQKRAPHRRDHGQSNRLLTNRLRQRQRCRGQIDSMYFNGLFYALFTLASTLASGLTLHQCWLKRECRDWVWTPIHCVKICVAIDTMLNFDCAANADGKCEQTLTPSYQWDYNTTSHSEMLRYQWCKTASNKHLTFLCKRRYNKFPFK